MNKAKPSPKKSLVSTAPIMESQASAVRNSDTDPNLATCRNPHNPEGENEAKEPSKPLIFTVITSHVPDRLNKILGLDATGAMTKKTAAMMSKGAALRVEVSGLEDLRNKLDALTSAQAITWGVTKEVTTLLCTKDAAQELDGAVPRSREHFKFSTGPGVMMLDHDGLPGAELSAAQFRARLIAAAPELADAPMLGRPSTSAGCVRPDGSSLSGLTRHRLYIPASDASLIPEAGKALEALLWATTGDGWCEVGKAGQRLPIDPAR